MVMETQPQAAGFLEFWYANEWIHHHLHHYIAIICLWSLFIWSHQTASFICTNLSPLCFYLLLLLVLSDVLSFLAVTLPCFSADASCCDLHCHCVCIISYFTSLTLNSAFALFCCYCALTWFKFKLACMSLANQMFCMITYGWATP